MSSDGPLKGTRRERGGRYPPAKRRDVLRQKVEIKLAWAEDNFNNAKGLSAIWFAARMM